MTATEFAQIRLRADTAANWTATNPTLAAGEPGFETDTNKLKIGDGVTAWTGLVYFAPPVTGGSADGGATLARTAYNPAAVTTFSVTTVAFADVDAVNLAVTFTFPASGKVVLILEGIADASAAGNQTQWNARDAAGDIANTGRTVTRVSSSSGHRITTRIPLAGVAGSTKTVKWGHSTNTGTGRLLCGSNYGPAVMTVISE